MTKEKQIEEMAKVMHERAHEIAVDTYGMAKLEAQSKTMPDDFADALYTAGYRKVHDDYAIQCVCYALGCQAAEKIKTEVAREISEEIIEPLWDAYKNSEHEDIKLLVAMICESINYKLKKKYAEGEG